MVETTTTGTSTIGTIGGYTCYNRLPCGTCYNRLPCGICRMTMTACPMGGLTITPSWYGSTEITCEVKGKE